MAEEKKEKQKLTVGIMSYAGQYHPDFVDVRVFRRATSDFLKLFQQFQKIKPTPSFNFAYAATDSVDALIVGIQQYKFKLPCEWYKMRLQRLRWCLNPNIAIIGVWISPKQLPPSPASLGVDALLNCPEDAVSLCDETLKSVLHSLNQK